ncbi:MAG: FecR family protein, partial [Opitutaceae bacterium]
MPVDKTQDGLPAREPTMVEQTALRWVTRCDRGLTPAQQTEFETWLADDPRHAELFNEFDGAFALLERIGAPVESADVATAGAAPAATLRGAKGVINGADAQESRCGEPPRPPRAGAIRRKIWLAFPIAAALAMGYFGWWQPAHDTHHTQIVATDVGTRQTMNLPDGSVVQLNTESAVSVSFTPRERRVRLVRGESHFTVAKNPTRPFIVEADAVAVRAVGTAFNVRLRSHSVDVLVTEGVVRVGVPARQRAGARVAPARVSSESQAAQFPASHPAGTRVTTEGAVSGESVSPAESGLLLSAGYRVSIDVAADTALSVARIFHHQVEIVQPEEIRRELAWQQSRLDFEAASLAEMVAEFNRYNHHKLVIADPALAARRFGGSFKADDRRGFVRMLQENFGVRAEEIED